MNEQNTEAVKKVAHSHVHAVNSADIEEGSGQIALLEERGRLCACGCGGRLPPNTHGNTLYLDECQKRIDQARRIAKVKDDERVSHEHRLDAFEKFNRGNPQVRRKLIEKANEKKLAGATRLFIRQLYYEVRAELKIRLANNHARFYAEDLNEMDEFKGMFRLMKKDGAQ